MSVGNPKVGSTGHYTAQCWLRGGFPYAERFSTPRGAFLFQCWQTVSWMTGRRAPRLLHALPEVLWMRHHAFRAWIEAQAPQVLLEIGAGLSGRGLDLASRDPTLTCIELDLPNMVAAKRAGLEGLDLPENYHLVVGDVLAERFAETLPVAPAPGVRWVAVTEGVIPYLAFPEKQRAWANIADTLRRAGGGAYLCEVYPETVFHFVPRGRKIGGWIMGTLVGRSFDERLFPTVDDAIAAMRAAGFDAVEVVDIATLATPVPGVEPPFYVLEARVDP